MSIADTFYHWLAQGLRQLRAFLVAGMTVLAILIPAPSRYVQAEMF